MMAYIDDVDLENSNRTLLGGLTRLLRNEISDWSYNDEHDVNNVWPKSPPESARNEFPRASIDIITASDVELDVDDEIRLREATVKIAVFSRSNGEAFDLSDSSEDVIASHWDDTDDDDNPYIGDWAFREVDDYTPLTENDGDRGDLEYSKTVNMIFETIRVNN